MATRSQKPIPKIFNAQEHPVKSLDTIISATFKSDLHERLPLDLQSFKRDGEMKMEDGEEEEPINQVNSKLWEVTDNEHRIDPTERYKSDGSSLNLQLE